MNLEKEIKEVQRDYKTIDEYEGYFAIIYASGIEHIAKHFYKLGLSVSNPITAADKGTAEEIIINLKRVEQDYRIDLTKEIKWVQNKVQKGESYD